MAATLANGLQLHTSTDNRAVTMEYATVGQLRHLVETRPFVLLLLHPYDTSMLRSRDDLSDEQQGGKG